MECEKNNHERIMPIEEQYKYGTLIAKLLRDDISKDESRELDTWVLAKEENMKLFEDFINEYKSRWAKAWFKRQGISIRGIKWRDTEGWYREDKDMWDFYIVMAGVFLCLLIVHFVLEL